ncbi:MFS transporter [Streptomyces sp. NPDC059467]|uniref:MFS transporter n=1 Tax=Streptomyces sp. NPDC059467 TaxID=3346844 RepID=UPI0036C2AB9C
MDRPDPGSAGRARGVRTRVPGGTLLARHAGWEAAFWAVAAMTALSTVALLVALPGGRDTTTTPPRLATELRSLMQPRLWVTCTTTALTVAAQFAIFSCLGALLEDVTGLGAGLVPLVLGLYGAGAFIGLTTGGRVSDRAPFTLLLVGMSAFVVAAAALAVTAHVAPVTIALAVILGAADLGITPAANARVFEVPTRDLPADRVATPCFAAAFMRGTTGCRTTARRTTGMPTSGGCGRRTGTASGARTSR